MSQLSKIIAIVGPTASGKTKLARFLAEKFNGELVSADSRQVYKQLNIGTGKDGKLITNSAGSELSHKYPKLRYLDSIPQWLTDFVELTSQFTAAEYQARAYAVIEDIQKRDKVPIIVGGSGLYVSALLEGYSFDPSTDRDTSNPRHADKQKWRKTPPNWERLLIGIDIPRDELYRRIDDRLDSRIEQGLIKEAESLISYGLSLDRLRQFGLEYKYLADLLEQKLSQEQFTLQLKSAIHAFARRQLSWWRGHGPVLWVQNEPQAEASVKKFLA